MAGTKAEIDALKRERAANNKIADAAWQEYLQKVNKEFAVELTKNSADNNAINASKSTLSEAEYIQKKIEIQKTNIDISERAITDITNIYNKIAVTSGSPRGDYVSDYQTKMRQQLTGLQVLIADAKYDITAFETKLNALTGKQSATEEEAAKAKAAEEATKTPIDGNTTSSTKASSEVADDEQGEKKEKTEKDAVYGLQTREINAQPAEPMKVNVTGFIPISDIASDKTPGARDFNPLSLYSSYTYNLTLSLVTPTIYNRFINGEINAVDEAPIIVRSGGTSQKRADGFELDFYIDDLELETLTNSKETLISTNTMKFKFKVYEPYGFSFPHKLSELRNNSASRTPDSIRGNYFLTIRFYGYTDPALDGDRTPHPIAQKSPHERTFCIYITTVGYKLEQGLVVYDITAVPAGELVALGNYGVITSNKSFQGKTVGELLLGENPDPSVKSVVDVLNNDEKRRLDNKEIEVANVYKIEIWDDDILNAPMVNKKDLSAQKTPLTHIVTPNQVNARTEYRMNYAEKGLVNYDIRIVSNSAGEPIINIIDTIISQSDFVRSKLSSVTKEDPINTVTAEPVDNGSSDLIRWYNITPKIKFLATGSGPEGKDIKRNNFAYEITYIIQLYKVPFLRTIYSNALEKYYGPYKRYQYWYTGQNTEVLSFDVSYNFTYQLENSNSSSAKTQTSSNIGEIPIATVGAAGARNAGKEIGTNEEVNSIRSWLYSPGELVKYNLSILGDPDYLMPAFNGTIVKQLNRWYGDDYAINPGVGQVFIEIDFKQAEDYDEKTGLLKTDDRILFMDYPKSMNPKPKGFVFMVNKVISSFSRGKFVQRLTGGLPNFSAATEKNLNSTSVSDPGRSTGYDSLGTNNRVAQFGVSEQINSPPVDGNMPGVLGTNRVAQFGVDNQISSPPMVDQTAQASDNDDNSGSTASNNNNTNSQSDEGGREPVYTESVAFNKGKVPISGRKPVYTESVAFGQRNVISNNV